MFYFTRYVEHGRWRHEWQLQQRRTRRSETNLNLLTREKETAGDDALTQKPFGERSCAAHIAPFFYHDSNQHPPGLENYPIERYRKETKRWNPNTQPRKSACGMQVLHSHLQPQAAKGSNWSCSCSHEPRLQQVPSLLLQNCALVVRQNCTTKSGFGRAEKRIHTAEKEFCKEHYCNNCVRNRNRKHMRLRIKRW